MNDNFFKDNVRLYDEATQRIEVKDNTNNVDNNQDRDYDNFFYQNNKQKGSAGLIVFIVILCIAVVGLSGYITYDKFFKDKFNNDTTEETKNVLEDITNENIVNELQSSVVVGRPSSTDEKTYYGLYLNASSENIDPKYLIYYGMSKLIEKNKISGENNNAECKTTYTISKKEVNDYIKEVLNIDISNYYLLTYSFQEYTIRQASDNYEMLTYGCKTGSSGNILNKLIKAEKDNDNIYIYSYNLITNTSVGELGASIGIDRADDNIYLSGFSSDDSRYEIYNGVKSTITSSLTDEKLLEKVNNIYKLTFAKNSSGDYYWVSSERINSL